MTTVWSADGSGETRTITDQSSKQRKLVTDGLGRLSTVIEAGAYTTSYTYDGTDHLIGVSQNGQARTFGYSTLGRLTSATNPESGQITYTYDNAGNQLSRIDARGVTASTPSYDGLGRPSARNFSDGTPNVSYSYTGCQVGQLCSASNSVSSTSFGYDALRRVNSSTQNTASTPYPFNYAYETNDSLSSISYPSGRQITYAFNGGGQVRRVTGVKSGVTTNYTDTATDITYAPQGAIASLKFGNGLTETITYNRRFQPRKITTGALLTLVNCFEYGETDCASVPNLTTGNNGNVQGQVVNGAVRIYGYDSLNRLSSASQSGGWSQSFGYDAVGNRWLSGYSGIPSPTLETPQTQSWFGSNNRVSGWVYDAAGNLVGIPAAGGTITRASCAANVSPGVTMMRTACYDAENRLTSVTNASGVTTTYAYDAEGRRVQKSTSGVTTTFVYDASGNLAAEYGGPALSASGTRYVTVDHLGSTRLLTKADGTVDQTLDYYPFGEEIGAACPAVPGGQTVKFTVRSGTRRRVGTTSELGI